MKRGIKGITIIALIVSVVIILILGTVTLNIAFGEEGFLQQSKDMRKKREREALKEDDKLNETIEYFDEEKKKNSENDMNILKEQARIGATKYSTLQKAIDAVPGNNKQTTIVLLNDINENIIIPKDANKNILLAMENHTITGNAITIDVRENNTLEVLNGTIISTNDAAVRNYGKLTINATAQITTSSTSSVCVANQSCGQITMSGGKIKAIATTALWNKPGGIINITGGTIETNSTNNAINNEGTATVSKAIVYTGKLINVTLI